MGWKVCSRVQQDVGAHALAVRIRGGSVPSRHALNVVGYARATPQIGVPPVPEVLSAEVVPVLPNTGVECSEVHHQLAGGGRRLLTYRAEPWVC